MIDIREPAFEDKPEWLPLWQAYLTFYRSSLADEVTDLTWQRLHDPDEPMHVRAAFEGERMVGITHFTFHRSTWSAHTYCYLEDLFVAENMRGRGIARQLILAVADVAKQHRCGRLYWSTQETNATARALYDKVANFSGFIQYRMPL